MVDTPPANSQRIFFRVENGHVEATLEKFPRAREKGYVSEERREAD